MSNARIEALMPLVGSSKLARRRRALRLAQLARLIAWFRREVRIRHTINELAALDGRQLADIGVSRGSIEFVARHGRETAALPGRDRSR